MENDEQRKKIIFIFYCLRTPMALLTKYSRVIIMMCVQEITMTAEPFYFCFQPTLHENVDRLTH